MYEAGSQYVYIYICKVLVLNLFPTSPSVSNVLIRSQQNADPNDRTTVEGAQNTFSDTK